MGGMIVHPLCHHEVAALCKVHGNKDDFLARFAIIGASAFVAGAMRSFAQVVIVFERTCTYELLLPLCSSALAANFVANAFAPGFFDSLILLKQLPHLPALSMGRGALTVDDIMLQDFPMLSLNPSFEEVNDALMLFPN